MTYKEKVKAKIEQLMYGFNLEADIASCENVETEKLANIKYQVCKKILEYIDSLQEEPVSDDLEKISYYFACMCNPLKAACSTSSPDPDVIKAFKAGAKWQKENMMAKAFDAKVLENYDGKCIEYDETILDEKLSDCNVFDKVKVIVIKEE